MTLTNQRNLFKNTWCLFGVTLSIYLPQGLFFVGIAGYFSQMKAPLIPLGNVFLLAMLPFVLSAFFLSHKIDLIATQRQLYLIKFSRTLGLALLGLGIFLGANPSLLIYATIIVYDLGFFLYQSISARMSKYMAQFDCLKRIESIILLGSQLGMAMGGIMAGFLLTTLKLDAFFSLAAVLEALGLISVLYYKENDTLKKSATNQTDQKHHSVSYALKALKHYIYSPRVFLPLILYTLLLPLQQLFNLVTGPWSEWQFHDGGQMLGWLVGGAAFGACIASLCLITFNRVRDAVWLNGSPCIACASVLGIYCASGLFTLLLFAVIFGCSFTLARVVIRAAFINKIPIESVNSATMVATMLSVTFSIFAIVFVSYLTHLSYYQIFLFISMIGFLQFILLNLGEKMMKGANVRQIRLVYNRE